MTPRPPLRRYTTCTVCETVLQIDPPRDQTPQVWHRGMAYCVDCAALPMSEIKTKTTKETTR